jgi:hypothetical protein
MHDELKQLLDAMVDDEYDGDEVKIDSSQPKEEQTHENPQQHLQSKRKQLVQKCRNMATRVLCSTSNSVVYDQKKVVQLMSASIQFF